MSNKSDNFTPINIETLILVAVWDQPFVFQGSFKILDKNKHQEHFLFYRCESLKAEKMDILEHEFSPYDYQFSHLYRVSEQSQIEFSDSLTEDALYLLKYALHITLTQMMTNKKHYFTYIDEIALISISKRIKSVLNKGVNSQENEDLGFAVAMDFNPLEPVGQQAVLVLLDARFELE
jgi:hypothetical protein